MPTVQVGILCNSEEIEAPMLVTMSRWRIYKPFSNILSSSRTNLVPGTTLISTRKLVIKAYVFCMNMCKLFLKIILSKVHEKWANILAAAWSLREREKREGGKLNIWTAPFQVAIMCCLASNLLSSLIASKLLLLKIKNVTVRIRPFRLNWVTCE
jgi:hypothetical protein